jgi:hypothetical protein
MGSFLSELTKLEAQQKADEKAKRKAKYLRRINNNKRRK